MSLTNALTAEGAGSAEIVQRQSVLCVLGG
jgi:hypothetical protein